MFQYTGTYILNSNLDSSGKPKWTSQQEDTMQDPVVKGSFNVKRVNKFIKDNVVSIFKREGYNPTMASATLKIKNEGVGLYRIALYINMVKVHLLNEKVEEAKKLIGVILGLVNYQNSKDIPAFVINVIVYYLISTKQIELAIKLLKFRKVPNIFEKI